MAQRIEHAVGDQRIETILHGERQGALRDSRIVWREYDTVGAVPNQRLDGWEELLVFTDKYVYRWIVTGFGSGPTVLPRNPETVTPAASLSAD